MDDPGAHDEKDSDEEGRGVRGRVRLYSLLVVRVLSRCSSLVTMAHGRKLALESFDPIGLSTSYHHPIAIIVFIVLVLVLVARLGLEPSASSSSISASVAGAPIDFSVSRKSVHFVELTLCYSVHCLLWTPYIYIYTHTVGSIAYLIYFLFICTCIYAVQYR